MWIWIILGFIAIVLVFNESKGIKLSILISIIHHLITIIHKKYLFVYIFVYTFV
jgi:hypothetical protein